MRADLIDALADVSVDRLRADVEALAVPRHRVASEGQGGEPGGPLTQADGLCGRRGKPWMYKPAMPAT